MGTGTLWAVSLDEDVAGVERMVVQRLSGLLLTEHESSLVDAFRSI